MTREADPIAFAAPAWALCGACLTPLSRVRSMVAGERHALLYCERPDCINHERVLAMPLPEITCTWMPTERVN